MKAMKHLDPNTTVSSQQLEHQLDSCDPLTCVLFSHSPSVQVYFALRSRLESCPESWLWEFVELDGLNSLLDSLSDMTSPKQNGFSDAILQIDCLSCIKAVMNSKVGMEALINSKNGIEKLLKGVSLANTLPRKLVFEILSVVCVYDEMGYTKLMSALEKYRHDYHLYHKYSFVVNELKLAETVPHKTSLLTFINAILCSTSDKVQRMRIRSQLIGLGLLDVLSFLQREDSDEDLYVQLQFFQEKKHADEMTTNPDFNVDLNSPQDLADLIQAQVFGGAKMVCFVNILQDLLAIETAKKEKSNSIWQVLEQHVHHVVHATDDIESLHSKDIHHTCSAVTAAIDTNAKTFQTFYSTSLSTHLLLPTGLSSRPEPKESQKLKKVSTASTKRRVSCADSGFIGCEDKISPQAEKRLKNMQSPESDKFKEQNAEFVFKSENSRIKEDKDVILKSDDSPIASNFIDNMNKDEVCSKSGNRKHLSVYDNLSPFPGKSDSETARLECLNNLNMKSKEFAASDDRENGNLNLNVIDENNKKSDKLGEDNSGNPSRTNAKSVDSVPTCVMRNLKWIKLEESLRDDYPHSVWLKHSVKNLKVQPDFGQVEEMFKEIYDWKMAETPLLSNDVRLKLNLFLNRCDEEPIELVKRLVRVDGPAFPLAFIKKLIDILPERDEVKYLKFYNGNLLELGQAEQFVLHLSDVPDYMTLLKGQLRRSELCATASRLRTILTSMLESSRVILTNEGLSEVLLLILQLGNFLNHGQFNGYAGGYKLSSLSRLADVKSQEAGHSLIHFIISLVEGKDDSFLSFLSETPRLKRAASCSLTEIKADFDKMNTQINAFVKQLASANPIIRNGFNCFLDEVKWKFRELQGHITELKTQSRRLAEYFCESESFDLQACFQHLLNFFEDLKLCQQEMKLMAKQKSGANKQTSMFSQQIQCRQLAQHFGQGAGASSSVMEEKRRLVDCLLTELHQANFSPNMKPLTLSLQHKKTASLKPNPNPEIPSQDKVPKTPEKERNTMELSRISLVGTPMINRPCSEVYDEDLTLTEKTKFATSSENDLLDGKLVGPETVRRTPVLAIPDRLTPIRGKSHYRSRSDLADSNINTKWIRYHDEMKYGQAPIVKPESSITLATLNLEARGVQRYVNQQNKAIALVPGPTVKLPQLGNLANDFVEPGKKVERKSALASFFDKISRKVLKPRNVEGVDNVGFNDGGGGKKDSKRPPKMEKHSSKSSSLGKISGSEVVVHDNQQDKENVVNGGVVFDRQKKNPIRLSNRFKSKIIK